MRDKKREKEKRWSGGDKITRHLYSSAVCGKLPMEWNGP